MPSFFDVLGDLLGDERAVLEAARTARLDVDVDPPLLVVAEGRPVPADRLHRHELADVRHLLERHVVEPGGPRRRPVPPRWRRTRSFAVVATKRVSTFSNGRVAPAAASGS
jgi:hypothetical protein